ncbi:hypothetical protein BV25DRAFT_1800809 [Artomyces pyxidatus]|uniref:Uncharacterized protein n=1 Tax=Artomyces pyxidatus TaxID=48021 RepID=A0ACB8T8B7_9AGAM|nr:hypothetical protein BV25DRAFT_1800809 [Artomyces pyxidatus]
MTSAPTNPLDIPPYQVQALIDHVIEVYDGLPPPEVRCAQALGSEIYVGCSNGELLRFALQANGPNEPESYSLLSRQKMTSGKPIDEIVLAQSISRALVLCDRQIHFYTLPSLDVVSPNIIKPIRNVQAFAVDHQQLLRPAPPLSEAPAPVEPVEFCVVKRSSIVLYSLRDQLFFHKARPCPTTLRSGKHLCVADREQYSVVNLELATMLPVLPISQVPAEPDAPRLRPVIVVVSEKEFLILSWNGASTMGLFITSDGDPTRGTLEWPSHPRSVCLDYPYVTALLPNNTIEVHNIESQAIAQVVPAPPVSAVERRALLMSLSGFLVPSQEQSEKLRMKKVKLIGRNAIPGGRTGVDEVISKLADEGEADGAKEAEPAELEEQLSSTPYDV